MAIRLVANVIFRKPLNFKGNNNMNRSYNITLLQRITADLDDLVIQILQIAILQFPNKMTKPSKSAMHWKYFCLLKDRNDGWKILLSIILFGKGWEIKRHYKLLWTTFSVLFSSWCRYKTLSRSNNDMIAKLIIFFNCIV